MDEIKSLIFRTDRIGDFILSAPFIQTYKKRNPNSKIVLVSSDYNYNYVKNFDFIDDVISIKIDNKLYSKIYSSINLFFKLRKHKYKDIIILDGKNRSFFTSFLLPGQKNVLYKSNLLKNITKFLNHKVVNNYEIQPQYKNLNFLANLIGFNVESENINIYEKYNFSSTHNSKKKYILIHLDEKWFTKHYYHDFTDIKPDYQNLIILIKKIIKNTNNKYSIKITSGFKRLNIINELIQDFNKEMPNRYFKEIDGIIVEYIDKISFFELESIVKNSSFLLCCEGGVSHASHNLKIPTLAFYEESRLEHIIHWTGHMDKINLYPRKNLVKIINDQSFFDIFQKELIIK